MVPDGETRRRLLELAYDVLPEEQADALRRQIGADAALRQAYEEAESTAALFAQAAKLPIAKISLQPPEGAVGTLPKTPALTGRPNQKNKTPPAKRPVAPWVRAAHCVVGVVAAALVAFSIAGYWHHRLQLADLSSQHLRLTVVGPARLQPEADNRYAIITSALTDDPLSAQIEFGLSTGDGRKLLMGHKEKTDENGFLSVTIPAGTQAGSEARLKIVATCDGRVERVDSRIGAAPLSYRTSLATDKASYRPGETIRYRAVTLSRLGLTPCAPGPICFEVRDPQGAILPGSTSQSIPRHGVSGGDFRLPAGAMVGQYSLVARSPTGSFEEQRLAFSVRDDASLSRPGDEKGVKASRRAFQGDGSVNVDFFPEGGQLVAGLENRVYFLARDGSGAPFPFAGRVVDDQGREVAQVETGYRGMGMFTLEPHPGESYRLEIASPAGIKAQPRLPEPAHRAKVVLTTGSGVFDAGKPLEFNVRATEPDLPLVAAAYCRGVLVGHQVFVTSEGANEVAIDLDEKAEGSLQLILFDYSDSPPRPVARRLVFRRPHRRLQVRVNPSGYRARPGQETEFSFSVTDEAGRPATAVLGLTLLAEENPHRVEAPSPSLVADMLVGNELGRPHDRSLLDFYLSDDPQAAVALDLLLGTCGWRGLGGTRAPSFSADAPPQRPAETKGGEEALPEPPALFDNLPVLAQKFQESRRSHQGVGREGLNVAATVSFFGAAGLLLLATMLTLMGVAAGLRVWVPAVIAAAAGCLVGVALINPEGRVVGPDGAVFFAPFCLTPDGHRQPVNAPLVPSGTQTAAPQPHPPYWYPAVATDSRGQARIRLRLPDSPGGYRLRVDAHGGGRLGSAETRLVVER